MSSTGIGSPTDLSSLPVVLQSEATVLANLIGEVGGLEILTIKDPRIDGQEIPVVSVPERRDLESVRALLDEYLPRPVRRVGTTKLLAPAAFYHHVEQFKGPESVIFADPQITAPSLTAVYDYHEKGSPTAVDEGESQPGWMQHRAQLALRMSDEWKAWVGIHAKPLTQGDFAAFLADHIADLVLVDDSEGTPIAEVRDMLQARIGNPAQMMNLARGIEVNQQIVVRNAVSLEDGSIKVSYVESQTGEGGQPLTTPTLFFITIPVFYAGVAYRIPVRVRYKILKAEMYWSLHLYRHDKTFEDAFNRLLVDTREQTLLPVLLGSPES